MRYSIPLFIIILFTIQSCTTDSNSAGEDNELEKKIAQLEKESAAKDSMINESLTFFSEIQKNLAAIELKKDEIRLISKDGELSQDEKDWILEQINHINYLREENLKKVKFLNDQLKKNNLKIKELENMIQSLLESIQEKDEQIAVLQGDLNALDKAYSRLFDAYQEKAEMVEELTEELNKVFYTYGTEDELVKNKVIERKNGFIGIGKKIHLMDNFNQKYFAQVDLTEESEIFIEGSDVKFITDHPSTSYKLIPTGKNTKIKILNARDFWKVSRYLVVIID
ncbi:MAG: hypothetical protein EP305_02370 [Bacteroidetes bacterium]|nr:MAG: hypothetical protein EP305_02370 [Bacteroidota bacterium]